MTVPAMALYSDSVSGQSGPKAQVPPQQGVCKSNSSVGEGL